MREEDDLCLCFHVSRKKLGKYIRLNNPRVVSRCSECFGAGTGCGWCIPFIEKLFEQINSGVESPGLALDAAEYRARRIEYLERTKTARLKPAEPVKADEDEPVEELIDELIDL